jgi:hypothetical protein
MELEVSSLFTFRVLLGEVFTLKMEAAWTSETMVFRRNI